MFLEVAGWQCMWMNSLRHVVEHTTHSVGSVT